MDSRLEALESYARDNSIPVLQKDSAEFLEKLVASLKPKNILEIGTAIGYSGSIMLLASPEAKLTTIDKNTSSLAVAKQNFEKLGVYDRVKIIEGDATEVIKSLEGEFDFIFLDGPKAQYLAQLPYLEKLLLSGGSLLADNVLFKGWVKSGVYPKHKHRTTILRLREFLKEASLRLDCTLYEIGDGLLLAKKINKK